MPHKNSKADSPILNSKPLNSNSTSQNLKAKTQEFKGETPLLNPNQILTPSPYSTQSLNLPPNSQLLRQILAHFSPKNSRHKQFIIANMIDYAGGIGSLARLLQDYYATALPMFEKYMNECIVDGRVCYVGEAHLERYDAVLNSAMFEHITKREHLEHINSLVKDDGLLIIHTVVRQNIPKNPQWFYVNPVHCAFHTNDSMQMLMQQWGYTQSLYSPIAKSWVLFKKGNKHCKNGSLKDFALKINKELEMKYFYHKDGFVDYWVD